MCARVFARSLPHTVCKDRSRSTTSWDVSLRESRWGLARVACKDVLRAGGQLPAGPVEAGTAWPFLWAGAGGRRTLSRIRPSASLPVRGLAPGSCQRRSTSSPAHTCTPDRKRGRAGAPGALASCRVRGGGGQSWGRRGEILDAAPEGGRRLACALLTGLGSQSLLGRDSLRRS